MLVKLTLIAFFFVFSFFFALLINYLLLRFSRNLGMRDLDEKTIRWATAQRPALGGISFYLIFLLSIIFYTQFIEPSSVFRDLKFIGVVTSSSLGFIMGLADDAYNTKPFLKFIAQIICGLILVATGTVINIFDWGWFNYLLTIIWIIGIMNSINMLDNMDSITTGVSLFIIAACILISLKNQPSSSIYFVMMLGVGAALMAFLKFNWHPSKMFMGDTGSQFLGAFLGTMGIVFLWNPTQGEVLTVGKQLIYIALAFLIPLIDTTTVTVNRLIKGNSPFIGGKDHTTHHLSYLGLTDRQVAIVIMLISLLSFFLIYLIANEIIHWSDKIFFIMLAYCLLIFTVLFSITHYSKPKPKS